MHINARSHSLDVLLDSNDNDDKSQWSSEMQIGLGTNVAAEGSKKSVKNSPTESSHHIDNSNSDENRKTTNRKSKSLDDLLDDDQLMIVEDDRGTQSMENITESAASKLAADESILYSPSPVQSEKMCENEVITVDNSMLVQADSIDTSDLDNWQHDSGIQCDSNDNSKPSCDNSSLDEDAVSNTVSLSSSTTSDKKKGKTFLNKYVKKVKNLLKK